MSTLRVIACAAFRRDGQSALHELARRCRGGEPDALARVAALVADGLAREAPDLDAARKVHVVAMAGHLAGTPSGRSPDLAASLVERHPTWVLAAGLERVSDAPAARAGQSRDPTAEAGTLRWALPEGETPVLLVDDVVHTGASLEAAWLAAPPRLRQRLLAVVAFRAED